MLVAPGPVPSLQAATMMTARRSFLIHRHTAHTAQPSQGQARGAGGRALVLVAMVVWSLLPSLATASSRSRSFRYTAATALPDPDIRTQYGLVSAIRSNTVLISGCLPNIGSSKSFAPSRPTLPQLDSESGSSTTGPRLPSCIPL